MTRLYLDLQKGAGHKYTRREGSPGNYRYYYGDSKQPSLFSDEDTPSTDKIVSALNELSNEDLSQDFLTIAQKLREKGVKADTKTVGEAFDTGKVRKTPRPHITNMSPDDLRDHIAFEIGNPNSPTKRAPVSKDTRYGAGVYDVQMYASDKHIKEGKRLAAELGMDFEHDENANMVYITENENRIFDKDVASKSVPFLNVPDAPVLYLDLRKSDDGLEGPFKFHGGRELHYDRSEGKYYDKGKDMYLTDDEAWEAVSGYSPSDEKPQGATQTGPRGGKYVEGPGGSKRYVGKANPHRDPAQGQFIAGGAFKSVTEDLSDTLDSLFGEELKKDE